MARVLLIFVDGVGIGPRDAKVNPISRIDPGIFVRFLDGAVSPVSRGGVIRETDARLGLPGLPQSATGQTAILTGINAAGRLGRHLSGLPNRALKDLLARESIFVKLSALGRSATFANAYQPSFFNGDRRWISVTTSACLSANLRLRTLDDLVRGDAVYQDFTHRYLRAKGFDLPERSPEEAARNLARIAARHDFTLYEYFITDRLGHRRDMEASVEALRLLERFVESVLEHSDPEEQLVLLTSDHGNIEDLSSRSHTLNPVPTVAWGPGAEETSARIASICDVTPAVLDAISRPAKNVDIASRS